MTELFFVFVWGAADPMLVVEGTEEEVVEFCVGNRLQWGRCSLWPELRSNL
jgi:hypothetical protein